MPRSNSFVLICQNNWNFGPFLQISSKWLRKVFRILGSLCLVKHLSSKWMGSQLMGSLLSNQLWDVKEKYFEVLRLQLHKCNTCLSFLSTLINPLRNSHQHGTKLLCWELVQIIYKSKNTGSEDEEKEKLMQRMLSCCYWCLGRKSWRVCLGWPLTSYCCLLLHQTCSNRQWNLRWLPLLPPTSLLLPPLPPDR